MSDQLTELVDSFESDFLRHMQDEHADTDDAERIKKMGGFVFARHAKRLMSDREDVLPVGWTIMTAWKKDKGWHIYVEQDNDCDDYGGYFGDGEGDTWDAAIADAIQNAKGNKDE